MIKKIIVLMILILISINNVSCDYTNGTIEEDLITTLDYTTSYGSINKHLTDFRLELNHDLGGIPDTYIIHTAQMVNITNWSLTAGNAGDSFNIYKSSDGLTKDELIGYGSLIIYKISDAGSNKFNVKLTFYFDVFNKDNELSGLQYYILSSPFPVIKSYYNNLYDEQNSGAHSNIYSNLNCIMCVQTDSFLWVPGSSTSTSTKHEYKQLGLFKNEYDITNYSVIIDINVTRVNIGDNVDLTSSKIKMVNYTDDTIYYQSSFSTSNTTHFLPLGLFNYYIVRQIDDYEHLIYTSYEDEEYEEEQPTLTTDKTYYNTSELINISFTNIDSIYNECGQSICIKPYDLHILYPISYAYKDYESKYIYPLTYSLQDETIILSTSFLSPENNYILGIVGINGDYHKHEDILIFSDEFIVYPDEEYLSVSCDSETSCYTYNNADITIYYQINNNSNIIIKDNDNNVINTYYNIIGNGSVLYHIPDDLYHENTYPNWKIYLNNTEYLTSFNKGITVYWSQFQTPTPTPTYTPKPTLDINISDTINEFKTETQPIKDLIFGLSEIVIDNPDYNKDNIVDESEINHWFNSLIPICIIFLLIVLYIGLKKNRND